MVLVIHSVTCPNIHNWKEKKKKERRCSPSVDDFRKKRNREKKRKNDGLLYLFQEANGDFPFNFSLSREEEKKISVRYIRKALQKSGKFKCRNEFWERGDADGRFAFLRLLWNFFWYHGTTTTA
ncbi:hypothetical protein NPIL_584171 [Nephila pilipes]|uniref:Uncharacterized protein n=1 Tax=Nephila pilipes TaxID=299642 RepID=A0A8X6MMX6_NEPPI|nr:hypothetical protein NPIL_584171 [Nephila pilipes]